MSTDFGFYCFDCRTSELIDNLRRGEVAQRLIENAGKLVAIYDLAASLEDIEIDVTAYYGCRLDLSWFKKHQGHRLDVIDEYGGRFPRCVKNGPHRPTYCLLKSGHTEECSEERPCLDR